MSAKCRSPRSEHYLTHLTDVLIFSQSGHGTLSKKSKRLMQTALQDCIVSVTSKNVCAGGVLDKQLDILAFNFFKLFAQYESSLKENGYFTFNNGRIIVNWDKFANQVIGSNFLSELGGARDSAEYILNNPPKKQSVNDENKIVWIDVPNTERSVQILFSHISRIRNNLYHGAKFNGTWFDPERSELLLTHALQILDFYKQKLDIQNEQ